MTKDFRHIPVVGPHLVPPPYGVIEAVDEQGKVAFATYGGMFILDTRRGDFRQEQCLISICEHAIATFENMRSALLIDIRQIDLDSTTIAYEEIVESYGISEEGIDEVVDVLREGMTEGADPTNRMILAYLDDCLERQKKEAQE